MQLTPEASYIKPNARRMLDYHFTIYATYPILLAPVVQKVDSTIGFPNTYPLDSDISGGISAIQLLNNWGLHYNARPKE